MNKIKILIVITIFYTIIFGSALSKHQKKKRNRNLLAEWRNSCGNNIGNHGQINSTAKILTNIANCTLNPTFGVSVSHANSRLEKLNKTLVVKNISEWSSYHEQYAFLPVLTSESYIITTINRNGRNMKRICKANVFQWHQDIQLYVAALQKLVKIQSKAITTELERDQIELNELMALKDLSRNILCEIETLANGTNVQIGYLTIPEMNRRLNFISSSSNDDENNTINQIDIDFTKLHFIEYIKKMNDIITTIKQNRNKT